jgi:hypothetical protein
MNMVTKPSKFKPKYIKLIPKYIEQCEDEIYEFQKMSGKTDGFEEKLKVNLPSVEGYCIYLKVPRSSLYEWRKENKEFKMALEQIDVAQKNVLMNKGLSGHYNPIIAKLILGVNHNMREKMDLTTDDKEIKGGAISEKQIARIAERAIARIAGRNANGDKPSST